MKSDLSPILSPTSNALPPGLAERFARKVALEVPTRRYLVRTVEGWDELQQLFRMRHDIFRDEYGRPTHPSGLDIDQYDLVADHLAVFDRQTEKPVATYRILCSRTTENFYSEEEFGIESIREHGGTQLELGRACVLPEHRNGVVLSLLWRGIAEYIRASDASLLFGCSSIKSNNPLLDGAAVFSALAEEGHLSNDFSVLPRRRIAGLMDAVLPRGEGQVNALTQRGLQMIPPLLALYLKMGGKVCGEPCYDPDFHCLDFFTVLRTRDLSEASQRKYSLC